MVTRNKKDLQKNLPREFETIALLADQGPTRYTSVGCV